MSVRHPRRSFQRRRIPNLIFAVVYLATSGRLPGRFASLLIVFQRLHRAAQHLGNGLKECLGFRVADAPDIRPAFLLGLLQHLSDSLGMLLREHLRFMLLHTSPSFLDNSATISDALHSY